MRALLRRLRTDDSGYSLIELVVVTAILGIVIGGLTTIFVSGSTAELDLNNRFQAQQQARLALDRLRGDIHCASAAQATTVNGYQGLKLTATNCGATNLAWCVVLATSVPIRFQLYRTTATTSQCGPTDTSRLLVADHLTSNSGVFTTATIPQNSLQTVAVDVKVSADAANTSHDVYELKDSIVLRNSTRCTTSGGCAPPTVP